MMYDALKEYLSCSFCQYLLLVSFLVGAFRISMFLFRLIAPLLIPRLDLKKRYNGGWALITGGSEGIGLAIAEELAKEGFHLILVSRNMAKLESAKAKIQSLNTNIQIEIKSIDFEKITNQEQYQSAFQQFLQKDVSILVNNVGYFLPRKFTQKSFQQFRRQTKINLLPIAVLSRIFIQNMVKRESKSGIINLGSISSQIIFAGASNYSATKKFDAFLSQALAYQYRDKIDILIAKPFFVTTAMIKNIHSSKNVTAEQLAKTIVDSLGHFSTTFGPFQHNLQGLRSENLYHGVVTAMSSINFQKFRKRYDMEKNE